MKKNVLDMLVAFVLCIAGSGATTASVQWIDWTTTSSGSLAIGSTNVAVTLTGNPMDLVNGDYYYNNAHTGGISSSGTYGGLMPSDLIQVSGTGDFTLTFDRPVVDPYIALVSVGNAGNPVTYRFNSPFSVISSGGNYWGYGGYSISGNDFTGKEYNGVFRFSGTYNSITFNIAQSEYWHGFNFGASQIAPVPLTGSMVLFASGLLGMVGFRSTKKLGKVLHGHRPVLQVKE